MSATTKKKIVTTKTQTGSSYIGLTIDRNLVDFSAKRVSELGFKNLQAYINDLIRKDQLSSRQSVQMT